MSGLDLSDLGIEVTSFRWRGNVAEISADFSELTGKVGAFRDALKGLQAPTETHDAVRAAFDALPPGLKPLALGHLEDKGLAHLVSDVEDPPPMAPTG